MKEITKTMAKVSKGILSKMVEKDSGDGWPPYCTVLVYQPKRPEKLDCARKRSSNDFPKG